MGRCANRPARELVPMDMAAGSRFHRLIVLEYVNAGRVLVRCDCGVESAAASYALRTGGVKSCGCLRAELVRERRQGVPPASKTHGLSDTPEYAAWKNIKRRIFNPACPAYPDYGGRGLTMAPEWVDDFEAFLAYVGPKPEPHLSIDRIDNDLGYVPGNLRWATASQQSANQRRWAA